MGNQRDIGQLVEKSVKQKPLQGKGDYLVRKLNAQAGKLQLEDPTDPGAESAAAARQPEWNYIPKSYVVWPMVAAAHQVVCVCVVCVCGGPHGAC